MSDGKVPVITALALVVAVAGASSAVVSRIDAVRMDTMLRQDDRLRVLEQVSAARTKELEALSDKLSVFATNTGKQLEEIKEMVKEHLKR